VSLPFFFFLLCLAMGLAAWTLFWWSVRSGQLKDPEAVAGEMLEQDDHDVALVQPASGAAYDRVPVAGDTR
jgi:cbb3-type cytochrome oxidase maturation protein